MNFRQICTLEMKLLRSFELKKRFPFQDKSLSNIFISRKPLSGKLPEEELNLLENVYRNKSMKRKCCPKKQNVFVGGEIVSPEEALLRVPPVSVQPDPASPCSRAQVTSHLVKHCLTHCYTHPTRWSYSLWSSSWSSWRVCKSSQLPVLCLVACTQTRPPPAITQ